MLCCKQFKEADLVENKACIWEEGNWRRGSAEPPARSVMGPAKPQQCPHSSKCETTWEQTGGFLPYTLYECTTSVIVVNLLYNN